jgi:broad specificity phosphatase PhoE
MRVHLVRHGESVCNTQPMFPSRCEEGDLPLTDKGIRQARSAAEWLAELETDPVVICSPARRTRQTAEYISKQTCSSSAPIVIDKLWDRDLGQVAGLSYEQAKSLYPEWYQELRSPKSYALDHTYPDGESKRQYFERVATAWDEIRNTYVHLGTSVIIVTHDGIIAMLAQLILEMPFRGHYAFWPIANCSVTTFEFDEQADRVWMCRFNDSRHLQRK